MRQAIKLMLIPMAGAVAISLILILVVWGGSWFDETVNERGRLVGSAITRDLGVYPVIGVSEECATLYDPVCGMDGVSYDNACLALRAGAEISYQGVCHD